MSLAPLLGRTNIDVYTVPVLAIIADAQQLDV
jgi:hypothetical protein